MVFSGGQPYLNRLLAAVFANVNQTFLDNAGQFVANTLRHLDLVQLRHKPGADAVFTMKALHSIEEEASTSNDFICCISSRSCNTSSRRRP